MGVKMILPLMASQVHKMVAIGNLPPACLYMAIWQLNIRHAKATEIQVPSALQVQNSWWIDGHGACLTGYGMWPLCEIILEAKVFFPPKLVCHLPFFVFTTNLVLRLPLTQWLCYLTSAVHLKAACRMHTISAIIFCGPLIMI